jgi:hypothetical protein
MRNYKFTLIEIGQIKAFLDLKWSFSMIQRHFKKCGKSISKGYLSVIKNQKEYLKIQSIRVIIVVEEKAYYQS